MSVQPGDIRAHLGKLLREESGQLERLHALLIREATVLRGDDVAAIERIGSDRHECTSSLTRLDAERREVCRMLSFGDGRDGLEQLLRWCDSGDELRRVWLNNLTLARRCKEHNDRNGAVVSVKLQHVQKLLITIRGGTESPVYAPQASSYVHFAPRELGQA